MAAIIKTNATMAKRALTSFMSYGALNKGFWSAIVIKSINAIKSYQFNACEKYYSDFFSLRLNIKKATKSGFFNYWEMNQLL